MPRAANVPVYPLQSDTFCALAGRIP
ncbi:hypothetical protein [Cryobacterium aureum]|nr:hypothetical protein [Cryobacterium aureum]